MVIVVMATTVRDVVVSVRLESEMVGQLDELATEMDRSRSFLIAQAVRDFVEREYAHLCHVREGEQDLEAGRKVAHEEIEGWVDDLLGSKVRKPRFARP
jgi:predicted transcriptional regulator